MATSPLNHAGNDYAARLAAQSRTPDQFKVAPKAYYHRHNYARFHFDLGGSAVKTVPFANYTYITDDKREQDQLDLVADLPGTFIYTIKDSDVAAAMAQELNQEAARAIIQTAQAAAAVNNQVFDPSAPIVPVTISPVHQTPGLSVGAVPGVVGMQNSLSGTQAVDPIAARLTEESGKAKPPSAADAAVARLAEMTAATKSTN